ncbi:hypothetical protein LINGRAHAP2_LOCUS34212 [Linum grandiflorum]
MRDISMSTLVLVSLSIFHFKPPHIYILHSSTNPSTQTAYRNRTTCIQRTRDGQLVGGSHFSCPNSRLQDGRWNRDQLYKEISVNIY